MRSMQTIAKLIAEMNDLLQLDHDAVEAYGMAIEGLEREEFRETLVRFRADHTRHIRELSELIEKQGGTPVQLSHLPTGPMKLAVQAVGNLGSDREVLLAFKSNERQVRDKYHRLADQPMPPEIAEVVQRNASDEERHYTWVTDTLERLGSGADTGIGRAEAVFERVHGRTADAIEDTERGLMVMLAELRRSPITAAALGFATVLLIRRLLR